MSTHPAILATQHWLEHFIIRFNICPFAKREFINQRIRYQLLTGQDPEQHLLQIIEECQFLDKHADIETTLLIFPEDLHDFDMFLDFLELAEQLLQQQGFEGVYQLASFHPDYQFADSETEDPANYTNRSPYPMLHLIREASIEQALQHYPHDPASIPENNIQLTRKMGLEKLQAILAQCFKP
jgi:hypothetical protein